MDLQRRYEIANGHCVELIEELRECGIEELQKMCRRMGAGQVKAALSEAKPALLQYIGAPPQRRRTFRKGLQKELLPFVLFGALFYARCGLALIEAAMQIEWLGRQDRAATAKCSGAAQRLVDLWPTLWPFEDEDDPFDGA